MPKKELKIVFGGPSFEHAISVRSAHHVYSSLDLEQYNCQLIYMDKQGQWYVLSAPEKFLQCNPQAEDWHSHCPMKAYVWEVYDNAGPTPVVFPLIHGAYGEDGHLQSFLQQMNLPYIGSNLLSSALMMHKSLCKDILHAQNLPVLPASCRHISDWTQEALEEMPGHMPFPLFVKPAQGGSSLGIKKATDMRSLKEAVEYAAQFDDYILIEKGLISPREFECAVIGDVVPEASSVGEIIIHRDFYDYTAKYLDEDAADLRLSPDITDTEQLMLQQMACQAFQGCQASGMARVDFLFDVHTRHVFISEINSIPGFTPTSLFPLLWQQQGLDMNSLVNRLVKYAYASYKNHVNFCFTHGAD